jgi:hypothetical protein
MPRLSTCRHFVIALVLLIVVPLARASAQDDASRRVDSVMRERDDLFDAELRRDTLHEETQPPQTSSPSATTFAPEFSARYSRKDLLGLRDRPFLLSYDRADGLFVGIGADLPRSILDERGLQAHLGFGYAFGSHYWQLSGGLRGDLFDPEMPLRLGAEGHIITDTRDAWKMDRIENTLFAAIAGGDARDYFQRRGFSASMEKFISLRTSLAVEYRFDRYRSSRREVGWSLFGPAQPFREVPPISEGPMHSVATTLLADFMSLRSWSEPQFGLAAQAEFGWGQDVNAVTPTGDPDGYGFQSFTVDARLKATIITKRLFLALRGRVGAATGDAPQQRWFSIGGAGTLPGYPQNEYWGNRLILIQSDILFQPIESGFGRNLRIIVSNDVGAVTFADAVDRDNPAALGPGSISEWKYSPGIYLGSSAARFRIGVAWRTDVMEPPMFVMRLSEVF